MRAARLAGLLFLGAAGAALLGLLRAAVLFEALRRRGVAPAALADVAVACAGFGLAAGLLVAAARLRGDLRANLALSLAAVLLSLCVAEVRDAFDDEVAQRLADKVSIIESLRRRGIASYGGVEPVRFVWSHEPESPTSLSVAGRETLPLAGISRRTTVTCREADAPWLVFEADEHGFNNPAGLWQRAPVDLAAVGDSFTAGSCVPPDESMVARLRERYPATLNLGVAGSGPLLMLAELREYLPQARPRIVLWCHFGGNDLRDLARERPHPILARYLEDGFRQGLSERQAELDAALDEYDRMWGAPRLARLAREHGKASVAGVLGLRVTRARLGLVFPDPAAFMPDDADFRLFQTILSKASDTAASWGGRLVFVYLPPWKGSRMVGRRGIEELEERARQRVLAIARGLGLPVIDVETAFDADGRPDALFACAGCHYAPAGYRLAGDTVLAGLDSITR